MCRNAAIVLANTDPHTGRDGYAHADTDADTDAEYGGMRRRIDQGLSLSVEWEL
jgi:hypothetical protein